MWDLEKDKANHLVAIHDRFREAFFLLDILVSFISPCVDDYTS